MEKENEIGTEYYYDNELYSEGEYLQGKNGWKRKRI